MARKGEKHSSTADGFKLDWSVVNKDEVAVKVTQDGKEVSDLGYPNIRGHSIEYLAGCFQREAILIARSELEKGAK